jgi:two-component system, LytTR family, response regulator
MFPESIHTVVADDQPEMRQALINNLQDHFPQVTLIGSGDASPQTEAMIHDCQPDLVFWDTDKVLPAVLAAESRPSFELVFTATAIVPPPRFTDWDFLLKPVAPQQLSRLLKRIEERRQMNRLVRQVRELTDMLNCFLKPMVELPTLQGFDLIPINEVICCESHGNYTHLFLTQNRKLLVTKSLKDIEQALSPHPFVRIHKQHLIHLTFMERYLRGDGGQAVMRNGMVLNVARNRKQQLMQACKRFQR